MRSTAARLAPSAAVAIVLLVAIVALATPPATAQEAEGEHTTFAFELQPDGDARVTVTLRLQLETEEQVEAFEQLREEHVTGASPQLSTRSFEQSAAAASASTGRRMTIRDVSRSAARQNRTGQFAITFTWTNFSAVADDRLILGDVFRSPDGTWLPKLDSDQELIVTFPDGYRVQSVSRPLQNGTIHVQGPATFEPGQPSAVLAGTPAPWWSGLVPAAAGAGVLLVVGVALLYGFWYRPRAAGSPDEAGAGGTVGNGGEAVGAPVDEAAVADDPLLSDEERVLRLLEREGGRMKQVDIVEATDWSNAKVSQLLSEMAEQDRIDKLRIGRENLISLPGKGPGSE